MPDSEAEIWRTSKKIIKNEGKQIARQKDKGKIQDSRKQKKGRNLAFKTKIGIIRVKIKVNKRKQII